MSTPTLERMGARSERQGECLVWMGTRNHDGYGFVSVAGQVRTVHRAAWIERNGPIPEGQCVLHRCDNPPCWRDEHLFLGSRAANAEDMVTKKRQAWGPRNGNAKLTSGEVVEIRERYQGFRGHPNQSELADEYGVSQSQVARIVSNQRWAVMS